MQHCILQQFTTFSQTYSWNSVRRRPCFCPSLQAVQGGAQWPDFVSQWHLLNSETHYSAGHTGISGGPNCVVVLRTRKNSTYYSKNTSGTVWRSNIQWCLGQRPGNGLRPPHPTPMATRVQDFSYILDDLFLTLSATGSGCKPVTTSQ